MLPFTSCAILSVEKIPNSIQIEFYSKGAGIDFKAKKLVEEFIVNYTETNKLSIPYTIKKHGKEGETTFVVDVSSLSKSKKKKFKEALLVQLKNAENYRIF